MVLDVFDRSFDCCDWLDCVCELADRVCRAGGWLLELRRTDANAKPLQSVQQYAVPVQPDFARPNTVPDVPWPSRPDQDERPGDVPRMRAGLPLPWLSSIIILFVLHRIQYSNWHIKCIAMHFMPLFLPVTNREMAACFYTWLDWTAAHLNPWFAGRPRNPFLTPLEQQPELLDLSLNAVSIMSSHNSYIRTFQNGARSTTDGIQVALNCGARCLELDIYREPQQPIALFVAHGREGEEGSRDLITTTKLPLRSAFAFLAQHAFEHTTDPLFLALELNMHSDPVSCATLVDELERGFGARLYRGILTPATKLRELVGKVVLMSGGGSGACAPLEALLHIRWSPSFENRSSANPIPTRYEGCPRIYPAGDVRGAFSLNFDPRPYLDAGATFVAMNLCTDDVHARVYQDRFSRSSFIRKP